MRKFYLLTAMVLSGMLQGQISITYSDYLDGFATGAVYHSFTTPIEGPLVSVFVGEASGVAQTWDFSGFDFSYVAWSQSIEPAIAPMIADFPSANTVLYEKSWIPGPDTMYTWNYKELQSGQFLIHGLSDETSVLLSYDPPAIHAVIPLEYGSSWLRERDSTFIMEGYWIIREATVTVDAFGEMKLPEGQYPCLRLTQLVASTTYTPIGTETVYTKSYHFYAKGMREVNLSTILEPQFTLTTIEVAAVKYSAREGSSSLPEYGVAGSLMLAQNYPNPFTGRTTVGYQVGSTSAVTLKVFDLFGNEITTLVEKEQSPGTYTVVFDAGGLPPGIYYCRLSSGASSITKKMMVGKK